MSIQAYNNKRIAKNTFFLYIRMLLTMFITLFTSRIVLEKLGITDFGIYNVVGGIVAMLGFLSGSMANAVQRYLSFAIGKNDEGEVNRIFNVSLQVHFGIAFIVFCLVELIGVWYLNHIMNIPNERLGAANWVLQCSILTTLFTIMQVPYNAIIIAKEQMGIYAYLSIIEVILKLVVVYLLTICQFDRLKLYSVFIMIITIGILLMYRYYCIKKIQESHFRFTKDWTLFRQLISFASWNMLGEVAWVFTGQGVNIILNAFFGPAINAARGLADQVNGAVIRFVSNFQVAVNPQLIKSYASNQLEEMKTLLYRSTRFSHYLLLALSMPLIINMEYILHLWLKEVPIYTTEFCQLILIASLISTVSNLLAQVVRAYGKIRNYQIVVSLCLFLNFPLSYIALKLGASPISTLYINISIYVLLIYVRVFLIRRIIHIKFSQFVYYVLIPIICVSIISAIVPILYIQYIGKATSFSELIISSIICLLSVCLSSFYIGINSNERAYIKSLIQTVINKIR